MLTFLNNCEKRVDGYSCTLMRLCISLKSSRGNCRQRSLGLRPDSLGKGHP